MRDPNTLRFSETHEWAIQEGDNITIGISQFAVDQLTDIVVVELPKVGAIVSATKSIGIIETVKAVADIYCPFDGEIIEVNTSVEQDPSILCTDPYGEGWLFKIDPSDITQIGNLLIFENYQTKNSEGH